MIDLLRTTEQYRGARRIPANVCEAPSCLNLTKWRKPFCIEHIERCPHPSKIVKDLCSFERELQRIDKGQYTRIKLLKNEVMVILRDEGECSYGRMAKVLDIPYARMEGYFDYLCRTGVVTGYVSRHKIKRMKLNGR